MGSTSNATRATARRYHTVEVGANSDGCRFGGVYCGKQPPGDFNARRFGFGFSDRARRQSRSSFVELITIDLNIATRGAALPLREAAR